MNEIKFEKSELQNIPVTLIDENESNEEVFGYDEPENMEQTMDTNGFFGAISVYRKENGRYEIWSGHRRFKEAVKRNAKEIPCIITEELSDEKKAQRLIDSNIFSRKMSPYRWAKALDYYKTNVIDKVHTSGDKYQKLAEHFNMAKPTVLRYLSILKLIPEFQIYTHKYNFPYYNFYEISKLDAKMQYEMLDILKNMAKQDDISILSKALIDQGINTLKKRKEHEEEQRRLKEKEAEERENTDSLDQDAIIELRDNLKKLVDETTPKEESAEYESSSSDTLTSADDMMSFPGQDSDEMMSLQNFGEIKEKKAEEIEATPIDNDFLYMTNRLIGLLADKKIKDKTILKQCINLLSQLLENLKNM